MATTTPNVWAQMNYVPPRGQCNFKASLMSPKCPCLRFMLHPLKSSSSFECDGCAHHASFHSMENRAEDEIRKRWEVEESERQQDDTSSTRPRKRLRQPDENTTSGSVASGIFGRIMSSMTQEGASMDEIPPQTSASSTTKVKMVNGRKIRGSNRGRNSAGRSRSRLTELSEEREETLDIIDVD